MFIDVLGWWAVGIAIFIDYKMHKSVVKAYHSMMEAKRLMDSWKH